MAVKCKKCECDEWRWKAGQDRGKCVCGHSAKEHKDDGVRIEHPLELICPPCGGKGCKECGNTGIFKGGKKDDKDT